MRRVLTAAAVLTLTAWTATPVQASSTEPADTVFTGGVVHTVTGKSAEAVAVDDGKIVYVGSAAGARAYVGDGTAVVRLKGRMVMPGVSDGHIHLEPELFDCSLEYAELTVDQTLKKLQKCLDSAEGGDDDWLQVHHWDMQGMKPSGVRPTRQILDKLKTKRPIYIFSTDGHNHWVNSRGLEVAGITAKTKNPPNGAIVRDRKGRPTGYLKESAGDLVTKVLPKPEPERVRAGIKKIVTEVAAAGVTSANAIILKPEQLPVWKEMADAGELPMRIHASVLIEPARFVKDVKGSLARLAEQKERYSGPNFQITGVKIFLDGVIEYPAQTAYLRAPYRPGTSRGSRFVAPAVLNKTVAALDKAGYQVHMHALGDGAVREGLDAVEHARKVNGPSGRRLNHSLAHLQLIDPADLPRFRKLNVLTAFSLQWAQRDPYTVDAVRSHLGEERWRRQYPAASLWRAGGTVGSGSDFPVDPINPFRQIEAAVTRTVDDPKAAPQYGKPLGPQEALTLSQSLRAHTLNAAAQLRLDRRVGSIEVGKRADLLLLDRDLLSIPVTRISQAKPVAVLVDGKVIAGALK